MPAELTIAPGPYEARLRRELAKLGWGLRKSRVRTPHLNDQGRYRVVDVDRNRIVAGERFDLDLEDVAELVP